MAVLFAGIVEAFRRAALSGWALLPYVLAGVVLGELLKLLPWTGGLTRALKSRQALAIGAATVLGAASPLCTFGTVPVVLQLFRTGVAYPALAAFLAASSLMNPQLFVLTWGGLGPGMALARLAAVLVFGLSSGLLMRLVPRRWAVNPDLDFEADTRAKEEPPGIRTWRWFTAGCWRSLQFVGFYVALGLLLGALLEVFLPGPWLARLFRPGRWYSVLLASLLGVPLYACGGGTIPLIRNLMRAGMSRGAALAFFLVGPATRPAPLMALAALLRPRFILLYLAWLAVFAVAAGVIYR